MTSRACRSCKAQTKRGYRVEKFPGPVGGRQGFFTVKGGDRCYSCVQDEVAHRNREEAAR